MSNLTQQNTNLTWKIGSFITHAAAACCAVLFTVSVLIALNHTVLILLASAWTPIFLFLLPVLTLVLATGAIFLRQPVHNLLCLISVFFTTVLLYLYVGAEFLAFLFLIVYVGAIAILFLFVIMLLHLKQLTTTTINITKGTLFIVLPTLAFVILGLDHIVTNGITDFFVGTDVIKVKTITASVDAVRWFVNFGFSDIHLFSTALYTTQSFLFFLSGLLLLTAMLGAIVLATSATEETVTALQRRRHFQKKRFLTLLLALRNTQLKGNGRVNVTHKLAQLFVPHRSYTEWQGDLGGLDISKYVATVSKREYDVVPQPWTDRLPNFLLFVSSAIAAYWFILKPSFTTKFTVLIFGYTVFTPVIWLALIVPCAILLTPIRFIVRPRRYNLFTMARYDKDFIWKLMLFSILYCVVAYGLYELVSSANAYNFWDGWRLKSSVFKFGPLEVVPKINSIDRARSFAQEGFSLLFESVKDWPVPITEASYQPWHVMDLAWKLKNEGPDAYNEIFQEMYYTRRAKINADAYEAAKEAAAAAARAQELANRSYLKVAWDWATRWFCMVPLLHRGARIVESNQLHSTKTAATPDVAKAQSSFKQPRRFFSTQRKIPATAKAVSEENDAGKTLWVVLGMVLFSLCGYVAARYLYPPFDGVDTYLWEYYVPKLLIWLGLTVAVAFFLFSMPGAGTAYYFISRRSRVLAALAALLICAGGGYLLYELYVFITQVGHVEPLDENHMVKSSLLDRGPLSIKASFSDTASADNLRRRQFGLLMPPEWAPSTVDPILQAHERKLNRLLVQGKFDEYNQLVKKILVALQEAHDAVQNKAAEAARWKWTDPVGTWNKFVEWLHHLPVKKTQYNPTYVPPKFTPKPPTATNIVETAKEVVRSIKRN